MRKIFILCLAAGLLATACNKPTTNQSQNLQPPPPSPTTESVEDKEIDFTNLSTSYKFLGKIPKGWEVEYISAIDSINIYDPQKEASSNLEKSQIFIRNFKASSFLTLTTVDVLSRQSTTVNGHEAVSYEIRKKDNVANFASQPLWRNRQHQLTDIRYSNDNPTYFYVIAYNSTLDKKIYNDFLTSLRFK